MGGVLGRDRMGVGWVGAVALATAVGVAVDFPWFADVARKEGPLEWASEVVLAVAVAAWFVRARSTRPRWIAVAVALGCAVVLGEELDWGQWLQSVTGQPNLHNAGGGSSYLLFALPWAVLYGAAARGRGEAAGVPPRSDAVAALIIAVAAVSSVVLSNEGEAIADEVTELALYGLVLLGALCPRPQDADRQNPG